MSKNLKRIAGLGLAAAFVMPAATANADAVADFYKGKTVTIVVTSGAGGLNALYGRTVGDKLKRHIPGQPNIIYQYMPGGGGLKGSNYCYNVAPKDGTYICEPLNPLALFQLLRPDQVKYDAGKFNYIGNASNMNGSLAVLGSVGVTSFEQAKTANVIVAGTGRASESFIDPTMSNALLGTKFKLVMGYKGGGALDLSLERGESNGRFGPLLSWVVRKQAWLDSGKIRILAQVGLKRHPDFANVPLLSEFAKNDDDRTMIELISSRASIGRPFVVPPGTPADRVAALRKAFVATMKDPAFQADIKKRRLFNVWSTGEEVQAVVAKMLATPKPLVAKVRAALGFK